MNISTSNTAGFTLVELLAGTTIFAIIMALLISILNSFEATGDIKVTKQRMAEIAVKAGEYYLSREILPVPTATAMVPAPMGEVPITAFHLNSKYRIDAWGRPMQYFTVRNDGQNGRPGLILIDPLSAGAPAGAPQAMVDIPQADLTLTPPTGKTLITGVQVNHRQVAGILISSGPNNVFEYNQTAGYPEQFLLNAGSDDIILAIDLTPQATQIARIELKKLGEKVRAFDDRYIGKDNDGDYGEVDGGYDEDGCHPVEYPGGALTLYENGDAVDACTEYPVAFDSDYLPIPVSLAGTLNDYSCGVPTLDYMKANYWGNNPLFGYYYPQITGYGRLWDPTATPPVVGPYIICQATPADYFRVPMNLGAPAAPDCHWGLIGDPAVDPNELTNDQTRAAIFCAYGLSPADIVDPWLNGYTWGCDTASGCTTGFPDTPPDTDARYHKFYSGGPDGIIGSDADGDGIPDDNDGNGFIDLGDDIVAPL